MAAEGREGVWGSAPGFGPVGLATLVVDEPLVCALGAVEVARADETDAVWLDPPQPDRQMQVTTTLATLMAIGKR